MARKKKSQTGNQKGLVEKFDLLAKLLGVIASEKDFAEKTQAQQVKILAKRGIRSNDIAKILGMKPPNVSKALKGSNK